MNISIVQIIIEVDGQLCNAKVPKGMEHMILSILQANEDCKIAAVKLPPSWKKISLAEAVADDPPVRDNSAFMEGSWGTDPRGRLIEQ